MNNVTVAGQFHIAAAVVSLATGAVQSVRPKGDRLHRGTGYVYAASMLLTNLSALLIYRFTGRFNVFHALALFSLFSVGMALRPMLQKPRPANWLLTHYMWILWSYVGLWAATVTEILVRVVRVSGWTSAAVGTALVMAIGAGCIVKFAPRPSAHHG